MRIHTWESEKRCVGEDFGARGWGVQGGSLSVVKYARSHTVDDKGQSGYLAKVTVFFIKL